MRKDVRDSVLDLIKPNDVCLEIGVWKSQFSSRILNRKPQKLYLVDPWEFMPQYDDRNYGGRQCKKQDDMDRLYNRVKTKFDGNKNVVIMRGYSSTEVLKITTQLDWCYIDGDHSYEPVLQDLQLTYAITKVGGYVCGDDYQWAGVTKAVEEFVSMMNLEAKIMASQFVIQKI